MQEIITRHRHEIRRRHLTVLKIEALTPKMRRIFLGGADLEGFISLGADDHVKLFFPNPETEKPEMRDYTPRAYDREKQILTLDFALHEAGPATAWAMAAKIGDQLEIAGPRGSAVVSPLFDWYLLIGDETALPAMGRWVEEMPAGQKVMTLGLICGAEEQQSFETSAEHIAHWAYRPEADAHLPAAVLPAVQGLDLPEGQGFIWIAAEAQVARALRDHFLNERAHPRHHMKAAGYWQKGLADAADKSLE